MCFAPTGGMILILGKSYMTGLPFWVSRRATLTKTLQLLGLAAVPGRASPLHWGAVCNHEYLVYGLQNPAEVPLYRTS